MSSAALKLSLCFLDSSVDRSYSPCSWRTLFTSLSIYMRASPLSSFNCEWSLSTWMHSSYFLLNLSFQIFSFCSNWPIVWSRSAQLWSSRSVISLIYSCNFPIMVSFWPVEFCKATMAAVVFMWTFDPMGSYCYCWPPLNCLGLSLMWSIMRSLCWWL